MIIIKNITKTLNNKKVLDNVNLEIKDGETLVIIGQSGCGKSVLLKHIVGLMKPDSGSIEFNGENITDMPEKRIYELRKKIGMVFQNAALFDSMTVYENISLALYEHSGYDEEKISQIVSNQLKHVNLKNTEKMMPVELSGGMRKRVGIARALAMNPDLLLYDEPTTGLDPITSDVINELIIETNKKLKITSIVVTHDMTSAYKIGDRIAMLYKGKIIATDSVEKIKNTTDPVIHQFINGLATGPITDTI